MTTDLAINNALIVTPDGVRHGSIGIAAGQIDVIALGHSELAADRILDAAGRVVLPGAVDTHSHFWDPGRLDRETWVDGTAAAAAGGITTVIEMPLSLPPTIDAASFEEKMARANAGAHVDYLLWGGIVPVDAERMESRMSDLRGLGVVGFKVFMCQAAAEFPACDHDDLRHALIAGNRLGVLIGIHAEDEDTIQEHERSLQAQGRRDPMAHSEARPIDAETKAIARALALAKETGASIYIVHMSAAAGAALIKDAKADGQDVFVETCPHYLATDDSLLAELGPWAKCAPPLRPRSNTDALWSFVLDGTIDTIGSDHAPFTRSEKEAGSHDIWKAPNGLTGIQTMLPLLVDEGVGRRGLSWERLAEITATNAARIFGLYPRKGVIAVGSDADFAIVDPDVEWTISGEALKHKNKWTPFEGRAVRGRVDMTLVRGRVVYADGQVLAHPGYGEFLGRSRSGEIGIVQR